MNFKLRIINIILRIFSMSGKFILVFFLAKFFTITDLALYGLIFTIISFGFFLNGLDFYTFSNREIIINNNNKYNFIINQLISQIFVFIIFLPIQYLIFKFYINENFIFYWFIILLFLEGFTQEIYRILISLNKQILATVSFAIKSSVWIYFLAVLILFYPQYNTLNIIFLLWTIGLICSFIFGLTFIYLNLKNNKLNVFNFNPIWIYKGYKVALVFFLSSIIFKLFFVYDRIFINNNFGTEQLGIYIFYITIIFGSFNILESAVFSFSYPNIIKYYHLKKFIYFKKEIKKLIILTFVFGLLISVTLILIIPKIIDLVNKVYFKNYIENSYLLILGGFIMTISLIPHYVLYAMKKDKTIIISNFIGFLFFILCLNFIEYKNFFLNISYSLIFGFSIITIIKTITLKKYFLK